MKPDFVNFDLLDGVTWPLYNQVNLVAWKLILPCFLLATVFTYFKSPWGSPEFLLNIKRLIITALLLVAFPEIAETIMEIGHWIAEEINPGGIETYWATMKEKALTVAKDAATKGSLLNIPNLLISIIAFVSYLIVYIATYFMLAARLFIWMVLCIVGPLLMICNLFSGTSGTTRGLFKSMFEVASWEILWAILFKILATLGYAEMYNVGDIFQTIVLNLIVALSMVGVPFLAKSLISGTFSSMAGGIQAAAMGTMFAIPGKVATATKTSIEVGGKSLNFAKRTRDGSRNFISPPQPSSTDMYLGNATFNKSLGARTKAFKTGFSTSKKEKPKNKNTTSTKKNSSHY